MPAIDFRGAQAAVPRPAAAGRRWMLGASALPLLVSAHSMYDACGRLYARGLPGVIPARRGAGSGGSV